MKGAHGTHPETAMTIHADIRDDGKNMSYVANGNNYTDANNMYEIYNSGAFAGNCPFQNKVVDGATFVHTEYPPDTMLKPRWIGDTETGRWIDAATAFEHERHIDYETDNAIKQWAIRKTKNEEYYINCGIRYCLKENKDTTDTDYLHYKEYRDFVEKQKQIGKQKKEALRK